ncbi:MAG: hypothetical protein INR62_09515 [Rhodospirillales bacterium]|nr:hypothetical protein [Acetobacter sp.]
MVLVRFCALLFLLQGILPPLLFSAGLPGSWLVALVVAGIHVAAAWGMWHLLRWGWWLAFVSNALQAFCISSSLVSWQLVVGLGYGFGFTLGSPLAMRFFSASSTGEDCYLAFLHTDPTLLASFRTMPYDSFVVINLIPAILLLVLGALREDFHPEPPET